MMAPLDRVSSAEAALHKKSHSAHLVTSQRIRFDRVAHLVTDSHCPSGQDVGQIGRFEKLIQ